MYRTCIFCHQDLGSNEAVETFRVGRVLAFDGAKGRLWVVCPHCRRWNLSPLQERWEAIEECERQFQDTARAYSTENIGLAELREGLGLIASIIAGAYVHLLPMYRLLTAKRTALRVRDPEGKWLYFMEAGPASSRLVRDDTEPGWFLQVSYFPRERRRLFLPRVTGAVQQAEYRDEDAVYVAGRLLCPASTRSAEPTRRFGMPCR